MSFAAVAALVAVAEWEMRRERLKPRGTLYRYAHGIVMTSLVGSLATMPFALFHFDRATHYAVLGNLIAMPVMGFWVMPAAALSVMLMPFGLEGPALALLGKGIAVMMAMGRWVSDLPGAVTPGAGHAAGRAGADFAGRAVGPALAEKLALVGPGADAGRMRLGLCARRAPTCWWRRMPQTVAIRGADGLLHFVRKPKDRFVAREWLRRDGDGRDIDGRGRRCRPSNVTASAVW